MANKNKLMTTCTVLMVLILLFLNNAKAQNETVFPQNATFNISTLDGKISFGVGGTYTSATLTDGTWSFTNLKLNGSQTIKIFKSFSRCNS